MKGIKKSCLKIDDEEDIKINNKDYNECVFKNKNITVEMNLIRSEKHNIASHKVKKLALCSYNGKRYMIDSINTLAIGHYKNNR